MSLISLDKIVKKVQVQPSINHLDKCFEFFKNRKDEFKSSCNFIIVGDDGKTEQFINKACHNNVGYNNIRPAICVGTDIGYNRCRKEWWQSYAAATVTSHVEENAEKWNISDRSIMLPFLDWFLNESYYKNFILERQDNDGIIVTADIPTPLLQNLLITSRYFIECSPYSFEMFNKLCALGIDKRIAYVCCFSTCGSHHSNFNMNPSTTIVYKHSGHRALGFLSLKSMKNFLNNLFIKDIVKPDRNYRINHNYYGGLGIHGENNYNFIHELLTENAELREVLSTYRKESQHGEQYKPPNPFGPAPMVKNPLDFTYTEMFECLLPAIHNLKLLKE